MAEQYTLITDWVQGTGLVCSITGNDTHTNKRINGLSFFRREGAAVKRVISEYCVAHLNGIHLEFEQDKPAAAHKTMTARKGENVFFLSEGGSTILCLDAHTFGLGAPQYQFTYDDAESGDDDALSMGHPLISESFACPTLGIAMTQPVRDGWATWAVIRDAYMAAAEQLTHIKRASEIDPLVKAMHLCLKRMNAIKTFWKGYSAWAYREKLDVAQRIPKMSTKERATQLSSLVKMAETYLDNGRGQLYKEDIRAHISIMWVFWDSFGGTKPAFMTSELFEELVIELLEKYED